MGKVEEVLKKHGIKVPRFGAEHGDGWAAIIDRLVTDMLAAGWDGELYQIKEKFGGLRFYIGAATEAIHKRIAEAEEESFRTCELCGAPAQNENDRGWLRTRCEACKDKK